MTQRKIKLGDEVVDIVTGFKGKAVAQASYLFGCQQFWVQPPVDSKGGWVKPQWIDEPSLTLIPKPKPEPKPKKRDYVKREPAYGGDREHPDPNDDNEDE